MSLFALVVADRRHSVSDQLAQCQFAGSLAFCSAQGRPGLQSPRGGNMNFCDKKKRIYFVL